MIKKLIGAIAALAVLAIIAVTVIGHAKYKSLIGQKEAVEVVER